MDVTSEHVGWEWTEIIKRNVLLFLRTCLWTAVHKVFVCNGAKTVQKKMFCGKVLYNPCSQTNMNTSGQEVSYLFVL